MIWLLKSITGEYEDIKERIHCYFDDENKAKQKIKEINDFDILLKKRFKNSSKSGYYDFYDFQRKCYRKFGINLYIDYTGVFWKLEKVEKL
jgi:hypothetical protein